MAGGRGCWDEDRMVVFLRGFLMGDFSCAGLVGLCVGIWGGAEVRGMLQKGF